MSKYIILLFFLYCTSLQKIPLEQNQHIFPKYVYWDFDYLHGIYPIQVSGLHQSESQTFLDNQIYIYVNEIQYENFLESKSPHLLLLENSLKILLNHLFKEINQKYSYINIIQEDNFSLATHTLNISINAISKEKEAFTFQIHFKIQRKNYPKVQYEFNVTPIVLQPLNQQKNIYILSKKESIDFKIPQETFSLEIPIHSITTLLDNFQYLGKGYVAIASSTKHPIQILNQKGIVWEGESPVHIPLWEGRYTLMTSKRGMETQTIPFTIREGEEEIIPIKWKDEIFDSYINFLSNVDLRVVLDEELKGNTPVFTSQLSKGNYNIELSKKNNDFYEVLYKGELQLKENHYVNLFYPIYFKEEFSKESFTQNSKRFFWFSTKDYSVLKEEVFSNGFLTFLPNQQLFTPNIILDELKSEFNLSCGSCEIVFYFEDHKKLLFKKLNEYFFVYYGKDPLELQSVYLIKQDTLFFYWDYTNANQLLCVYLNSSLAFQKNIPSHYVVLEFKNIDHLILKNFSISEKSRENFFMKKLYLLRKQFQKKEKSL